MERIGKRFTRTVTILFEWDIFFQIAVSGQESGAVVSYNIINRAAMAAERSK
jgi:hypothetical protein